jgi:hypothetical protein
MSNMKFQFYILTVIVFIIPATNIWAQDTLIFKGQLSAWGNYSPDHPLTLWSGGRYIPALNYSVKTTTGKMLDMEISANVYGSIGTHPFDTTYSDGLFKPYRTWIRYSSNQFEIRFGLQKINFGSATLLRPLMWFDQIDPRDPLQLTDGVWGLLGRYYFLNNANIWLWGLYGNTNVRTWDIGKSSNKSPEFGGRFQAPIPKGEAAVSYNFRQADTRDIGDSVPPYAQVAENRVGIDAKWDLGVGLWVEGSWINKSKNLGMYTNQELFNCGTDYTFGIGNGLNIVLEHLQVSYDKEAFKFVNNTSITGASLSYPIGLLDNINTIIYYDWSGKSIYSFLNWKRQYNKISFYFMVYWNPENYKLPQQNGSENLFVGKGIQIMWVFNH